MFTWHCSIYSYFELIETYDITVYNNITVESYEITSLGKDFSDTAAAVRAGKNRVIVLMTEYNEGLVFLQNAAYVN